MPGIGQGARRVETEDGYICSACRRGVDDYASACPHCNRHLRAPTAPFAPTISKLGAFLFVVGAVSVSLGFVVADATSWMVSGGGGAMLLGAIVFLLGLVVDKFYPVALLIYRILFGSLWWVFSPFYRLLRGTLRKGAAGGKWSGKSVISAVRWCERKAIDLVRSVFEGERDEPSVNTPNTAQDRRMRAGVRGNYSSERDSERD